MKASKKCPKCDGRTFFQIARMQQTYCDAGGSLRNLEVLSAMVQSDEKGLFGGDKQEMLTTEPFECVVCATCGYIEWYANRNVLKMLADMAAKGSAVRVVTNEAPASPPFR